MEKESIINDETFLKLKNVIRLVMKAFYTDFHLAVVEALMKDQYFVYVFSILWL